MPKKQRVRSVERQDKGRISRRVQNALNSNLCPGWFWPLWFLNLIAWTWLLVFFQDNANRYLVLQGNTGSVLVGVFMAFWLNETLGNGKRSVFTLYFLFMAWIIIQVALFAVSIITIWFPTG